MEMPSLEDILDLYGLYSQNHEFGRGNSEAENRATDATYLHGDE